MLSYNLATVLSINQLVCQMLTESTYTSQVALSYNLNVWILAGEFYFARVWGLPPQYNQPTKHLFFIIVIG